MLGMKQPCARLTDSRAAACDENDGLMSAILSHISGVLLGWNRVGDRPSTGFGRLDQAPMIGNRPGDIVWLRGRGLKYVGVEILDQRIARSLLRLNHSAYIGRVDVSRPQVIVLHRGNQVLLVLQV